MSRKRQPDRLELNFDGLTDSVTNLVGALILLVVLLIGVTREVVVEMPPPTAPDSQSQQTLETADDLLRRMERLRREIDLTERKTTRAEERMVQLKEQTSKLLSEAAEP